MEHSTTKDINTLSLTDLSLFQYQHTPDLYEQLLSDHLELPSPSLSPQLELQQLELIHNKTMADSSEAQEIEPKAVAHQCSCARSRCCKNYCECFRAGRQCQSHCKCINCFNGQKRAPKFVKKESIGGGCNCKKSHCLKNYCECHSRGALCSSKCNCLGCQNGIAESQERKEDNPFVVIDSFYS